MAKTIKNTKTKQKSTKSQKPTAKQEIKTIVDVLYSHRKCLTNLASAGEKTLNLMRNDFNYHEGMRKAQDEYIESNFRTFKIVFIVWVVFATITSGILAYRADKLETRLTQVEAAYEVSRSN